jgi:selenocysteine-specific elongation factor
LTPSPDSASARVRSLHAQNQPVDEARAGQRCAIGLVGIAKEQIARGQWLTAPAIALATDRLDARITLWPAETQALRSGAKVHLHLGATDVMASVAVLRVDDAADGEAPDSIAPGRNATVQLVLREPIGAWRGDRLVLRDASATRTLAGGLVLDPFAPARYRRTAQRAAELAAWSASDAPTRLRALLEAAPLGVWVSRWAQAEGLDASLLPDPERGDWRLAPRHQQALGDAVITALRDFHAREPEMLGPDSARLRRLAAPRLPEPLWKQLLEALQHESRIALRAAFVHLPEHALKLSAADERLAQKTAPMLASAGFEGVWVRDLAKDARESEFLMRTTLARLAQRGELHQVVKDLCYAPQTLARLAAIVREIATANEGAVTAAVFRDATGLGRKRAIQLLEYFDRVGLLRRVGDAHRLRSDSTLFIQAAR